MYELVDLDANRDGAVTADGQVYGAGNNRLYLPFYATTTEEISVGSYIRWANMMRHR